MSSSELVPIVVGEEIALGPAMTEEQLQQVAAILSGQAEYDLPEVDTSAVVQEIVTKMLFAETEEELLADVTTWSTKDSIGKLFQVLPDGRLWPSQYRNAETGRKGAFLSVRAVNEDGEIGVLNTSSARIVAKLVWYAKHDQLPARFQVVSRGESAAGYAILDVEKA